MGLSIGVHLLNLLTIPAIALIYYFKKFEPTFKGSIIAFMIGFAALIFVQYGIIPQSVAIASKFEWAFVNWFGLPFHSGVFFFIVLTFGLLIYGMKKFKEKNQPVLYKSFFAVMVILFGYSSFAMIIIRSQANTPMDENNPENIFSLLPYLNREQYGDRPLLYGKTFNAQRKANEDWKDGSPVIYADEAKGEYYIADDRKNSVPTYFDEFNVLFPRMYSDGQGHAAQYKKWSNFEGREIKYKTPDGKTQTAKIPTFGENIQFFVQYQINFMYWRYFMWNFSGRQNDIQGHGNPLNGNWISGIDMIDNELIGNQDKLPESMKSNEGRNAFFMLPFILGIIGMVFHFNANKNDFVVSTVLFLLTGLAIILYLNQYPLQPRERDYAYAGSFYAFSIFIGLGVQGLYYAMKNKIFSWDLIGKTAGGAVAIGVVLYALESMNETPHGFSYSMIYIGLVMGGLLAISRLIGAGISNNAVKAVLAGALTCYVPYVMANDGWDDHNRANRYTSRDFAKNYLETCDKNGIIFTNGDNDTFPLWYLQEVEEFRTDVRVVNLSLLNTDWYIDQMKRKAYDSDPVPFSLTEPQYRQGGSRDVVLFFDQAKGKPQELKPIFDRFIGDDKFQYPVNKEKDQYINYFPNYNFKITVDSAAVVNNGIVAPEDAHLMERQMVWGYQKPKSGYPLQMYKNKLMMLDLLAHADWKRPVYIAITVGGDNHINLENYFQLDGLAYKIVPIKNEQSEYNPGIGRINTDILYDRFMNKFVYGNVEKEGVYLDENNRRMCMNYRSNFSRLSLALINDNKLDSAKQVLDRCVELFPNSKIPYDYFSVQIAQLYNEVGEKDKALEMAEIMKNQSIANLDYYFSLQPYFMKDGEVMNEIDKEMRYVFMQIAQLYMQLGEMDMAKEMNKLLSSYYKKREALDKFAGGKMSEQSFLNLIESENTQNEIILDDSSEFDLNDGDEFIIEDDTSQSDND